MADGTIGHPPGTSHVIRNVRTAKTILLVGVAAVCCLFAWGALRNLWGGGDSPHWAYLLIGGLWVLLAGGCLFQAGRYFIGR